MNKWLEKSIEIANNQNYLDKLFDVYPITPESNRIIETTLWESVMKNFEEKNDKELFDDLLKLDLFPLKDSYVAYFKKLPNAISLNPDTIDRLLKRIYSLGLDKLHEICSQAKETNRQIGPMFGKYKKQLNLPNQSYSLFVSSTEDAILDESDNLSMKFARNKLSYSLNKGLDLIARVNNKYIIGEAKFLTDFGGHQNAQLNDAINVMRSPTNNKTQNIGILDGVVYIKNEGKMFKELKLLNDSEIVISALLLDDYLESLK
jgi:hypothetical protein